MRGETKRGEAVREPKPPREEREARGEGEHCRKEGSSLFRSVGMKRSGLHMRNSF